MENTLIWLQEMEDNNESWVKISSVITMLKKEQEKAINYNRCCKSDSEQLACDCDRQPLRYNEFGVCKYCGKQKPTKG